MHSFCYLLTYSMEKIPFWETNRFSASQVFPGILGLWNPKDYLLRNYFRNKQTLPKFWRNCYIISLNAQHMPLFVPATEREETKFKPIWAASGCWQQGEPADSIILTSIRELIILGYRTGKYVYLSIDSIKNWII